jgi:hypothetical protein
MQIHMQTDQDQVNVSAEVTNIEVEDMSNPDVDDFFCQAIRITGFAGEAIEIVCKSPSAKRVGCHRVKKLKPVNHVLRYEVWLKPEIYTGDVSEDTEQQSK